jgi:[ribosomal protein S5]-alanine N-acetyltransferase
MQTFILSTPRLTMREFTSDDLHALHHILNDREVMRYFPNPEPPSLERVKKMLANFQREYTEQHCSFWALEKREDSPGTSKTLLGWCGLGYLPKTNENEVAYLLGKAHWGKGYATEAARACIHYGFKVHGFSEIIGLVLLGNQASQHVLEKIGLRYIGYAQYFHCEVMRFRIEHTDQTILQ